MVILTLAAAGLGVLTGALGTTIHAQWVPWLLLVALAMVIVAGVWVRTWRGLPTVVAYAVGVTVAVQVLAAVGPGGDVLVTSSASGYAWVFASPVAALLALVLPARWFSPGDSDRTETLDTGSHRGSVDGGRGYTGADAAAKPHRH